MKRFLEKAAQKILAGHGANMARVLVVMPNRRSCTYLRDELKRQAVSAVIAPEIITLQNLMLEKSNLALADTIELVTDLYVSLKELGHDTLLDDFIGTALVMLDDFSELDLYIVDEKLFFRNLELLQSMKTYEPGEEPDEYKLKYRRFWEEFGQLYRALRKQLYQKKKGYMGMVMRDVAENLNAQTDNGDWDKIYVIGFNGMNRAEEKMVAHLQRYANTEMMWDADWYYVEDDLNEAGDYIRKYREPFKITKDVIQNNIKTGAKNIEIIGAAKNMGQVKVVSDILRNRLNITEANAPDTVIVMPDEKLLSPLMANLPTGISAVNITMGLNIGGTNAATWLGIIFRLYENSVKYKSANSGQRFYYRDVFELLQHNFFRRLYNAVPADNFIRVMKEQNRILIRRDELTRLLGPVVNELFFEGDEVRPYADFIAAITTKTLNHLIALARSGDTSQDAEAEILFRILNIVQHTSELLKYEDGLSIKTYTALLKENFRNERVPLQGEPVKGLQVMGLLETRNLDFKNVIILSANEGILPGGKSMRSYIPYELQREFLITYKERDAQKAYLFYRLLHYAENVFILYNTEPDELGGGEKSRYILQLEHELAQDNKDVVIKDLVFAIDPPAPAGEEEINITKEGFVPAKIDKLLLESGMSPSALNTYINCSLQYYFRYIAGIREQDDMEESMEAASIGSAVHFALQKIYEQRKNEPIDAAFLTAQVQQVAAIEEYVRTELSKKFDNESLSRGKNLLLFKVCVKLVLEFLKQEISHIQELDDAGVDMRVEMLEEELEATLQINGKPVKVKGRVDRIECVDDTVHIADYKTSKKSTIPLLDEETWQTLMRDPKYAKPVQLLVYAWLYYRSNGSVDVPIRSGIYWLRETQKKLHTLSVSKTSDIITTDTILIFEEKLKEVLAELMDESIPFKKTDDKERCTYCEFIKVCGRD